MTISWLVGTHSGLLVDASGDGLPVLRHWGPDPSARDDPVTLNAMWTPAQTQASVDSRVELDLCPSPTTGFHGVAGLTGAFADGTGWAPRWRRRHLTVDSRRVTVDVADDDAGLQLDVEVTIDGHDVVALRAAITNVREATGPDPATTYHLGGLRLTVPVPDTATEVATFAGRWLRELQLQRQPWPVGRVERSSDRGRSSHEDPPTLFAGRAGFSEERGEVWAVHLAWPGNHELRAERTADGFACLQAGERLHPGEVALAPGESYVTPWLLGTASAAGLNGVSDAFHAHLRARPHHPRRPRPVTLNTWEAVYFDHDRQRLEQLVELAADVGVERFVLDDGWFVGREDDRSGLGDWVVDERKHPGGLAPLAARVRAAGMEFGLWVEPEMVNPDSERFRADPTVALGRVDEPTQRWQRVLDIARPDVWNEVRDQLLTVLADAQPAYLKWDHNRDQTAPVGREGRAAAHVQVPAVTALMDELRRQRPGLEIESCASGGGRLDLGTLDHTDRVWLSDTNDPIERQRIQRGASYLLPPELVGAHVGGPLSHTTARVTSLPLRLATAFFGHLGVEWDLAAASAEDRSRLAQAIELHKQWREVLHEGRVVRVDHPDPTALVHGVVTDARGVFAYVQLDTSAWARPAAIRCPGLAPDTWYEPAILWPLTSDLALAHQQPGWYGAGRVTVSGHALATTGLTLHVHQPASVTVIALTRAESVGGP